MKIPSAKLLHKVVTVGEPCPFGHHNSLVSHSSLQIHFKNNLFLMPAGFSFLIYRCVWGGGNKFLKDICVSEGTQNSWLFGRKQIFRMVHMCAQ